MAGTRRKKDPKADLHVMITPLVIEYFESTRNLHGRDYSEFVEEKMIELISEYAPDKKLELQLEEAEKKVSEIKKAMIEVKLLKAIDFEQRKAKDDRAKLQNEEQSKLKAHREKMFLRYRKTLEYQREHRQPHDWGKIQEDFRFKNKVDAQEYIDNMLEVGVC